MTALILIAVVIGLVALLVFPVVGIAMLPVVALGALALVAWLVLVLTRGPRSLPDRRTPGER